MEATVEYAPASGLLSGIWLLVAIPLASAAVLLLLGRRADKWGHWLGVLAVAVPFVIGLSMFFSLSGLDENRRSAEVGLYDFNLATYDAGDSFDQSHSRGFIEIYGMSSKLAARRDASLS